MHECASRQHRIYKALRPEHAHDAGVMALRAEFERSRQTTSPYLQRALAYRVWRGRPTLIFDDLGPYDLATRLAQGPLPVAEALTLVLQVARALVALHAAHLAHCDVTPENILAPPGRNARLVDFGLAMPLPDAAAGAADRPLHAGDLRFCAPEQTRRTGHPIDARTDLYGLGATLFALLAGRPPFEQTEAAARVHALLTQSPPRLSDLRPDVPPAVDQLVARLLQKDPAERYPSAAALVTDLTAFCAAAQVGRPLPAPTADPGHTAAMLPFPEGVFGRQAELGSLERALADVAAGVSRAVLVGGFSGVGKSSLVRALRPAVDALGGRWCAGKFDQFGQGVAWSAWTAALEALLRGTLEDPADSHAALARRLSTAVGDDLPQLLPVIPSLSAVIRRGAPGAAPVGIEAQNRFRRAMGRLLMAFAKPGRPLCVFLDDLQWADVASLELLAHLVADSDLRDVLLLGAFRDHEVDDAHRLRRMVLAQETPPSVLTLQPLDQAATRTFVSQMLRTSPEVVGPLAAAVHRRTEGNPLFTGHLLRALYEADALTWVDGRWRWQLSDWTALAGHEGVVELMVRRIGRLPDETRAILARAAAIGVEVDLALLAQVSGLSAPRAWAVLGPALAEGMVVAVEPRERTRRRRLKRRLRALPARPRRQTRRRRALRFVHDRVQQAADRDLPAEARSAFHCAVGCALLRRGAAFVESRLFDVVRHLALGRAHLGTPALVRRAAELERKAMKRAMEATAYAEAMRHGAEAATLLGAGAWATAPIARGELELDRAVTASLAAEFAAADAHFAELLARVENRALRARAYMALSDHHLLQARFAEGVAQQLAGLRFLGVALGVEEIGDLAAHVARVIDRTSAAIDPWDAEAILARPFNLDVEHRARLHLLYGLFLAAYLSGREHLPFLALAQMAAISHQHGHTELSAYGYVGFGMLLTLLREDFERGRRFGEVGVALSERFDDLGNRCKACFLFAADVHNWTGAIADSLHHYERAHVLGLAVGDWLTVGYVIMQSGSDRINAGEPLLSLESEYTQHLAFLRKTGNRGAEQCLQAGILGPIRHLRGEALGVDTLSFSGKDFDDALYQAEHRHNDFYLAWIVYAKIRAAALTGGPADWAVWAPRIGLVEASVPSHTKVPEAALYAALMHLWLAEAGGPAAEGHRAEAARLQDRLARWDRACPSNVGHKHALLQGERARSEGRAADAVAHFEASMSAAERAGSLSVHALAAERLAAVLQATGQPAGARLWRQEAWRRWARWGATRLVARHDLLLAEEIGLPADTMPAALPQRARPDPGAEDTTLDAADLAMVLALSRELASASDAERLPCRLLELLAITAGARRGLLAVSSTRARMARAEPPRAGALGEGDASTGGSGSGGSGAGGSGTGGSGPAETGAGAAELLPAAGLLDGTVEALSGLDLADPELARWCPRSLVRAASHHRTPLVLADARVASGLGDEAWIRTRRVRSLLCLPLTHQGEVAGVLYLDNDLVSAAFTPRRVEMVSLLAAQGAVSLVNARLYGGLQAARDELELRVVERTQRLEGARQALEAARDELAAARELAEESRREAEVHRARAEQANEAKSAFLSNVSHELRTPLNSMLGFVQLLQQREELGEEVGLALRIVGRSGAHLLRLVEELLDLARIEAGQVQVERVPHRVAGLLEQAMHGLVAGGDGRLRLSLAADLPEWVETDARRVTQILVNLLGNALKFAPEGAITLAAHAIPRPSAGHTLVLSVSDEGPGISAPDQARIFSRFARSSLAPGTGLGLPIARELCRLLGGDLVVESTLGQGSRFTASIAVGAAAPASEKAAPARFLIPRGYAQPTRHVAVVEDHPDSLALFRATLESLGLEVSAWPDAEALLDTVPDGSFPFDLLLTDLHLPGLSGEALVRHLRGQGVAVPVVFVTAQVSRLEGLVDPARRTFGLAKPVAMPALIETLGTALDLRWQAEPPPPRAPSTQAPPAPEVLAELAELARAGRTGDLLAYVRRVRLAQSVCPDFLTAFERAVLTFNRRQMLEVLSRWVLPIT